MKKYFKYKVMIQTHLHKGNMRTRPSALFRWLACAQLLIISFSCNAFVGVQPKLTENQAIRIVDDAFKMQPLFWQGFAIPHRIERGSKHKNAAMLEVLFNHQLLIREKETQVIKIQDSNRKRIALNYLYSFADQDVGARISSRGGFYYGYGRLKKILQLSKPYFVGEFYYAEAYVQWYVTDIQDWVDAPAFDKARTLRRSLESKSKPFEKRVYLQYNGQDWAFWKGKPGGL
jgi:hypothetical protein